MILQRRVEVSAELFATDAEERSREQEQREED